MKKMVFLEGLPGVGKTTIVNEIEKLNLSGVCTVNEIIKENIINLTPQDQTDYILNDEMKIQKYFKGLIVIDRGPISTLSYNQTRRLIDNKFNSKIVENWFVQFEKMYKDYKVKVIYLTTNNKNFNIQFYNEKDPYGSIENQKLLEAITIYNCRKFVCNFSFKEYHKNNMEEIIYEIIN